MSVKHITQALLQQRGCPPEKMGAAMNIISSQSIAEEIDEVLKDIDTAIKAVSPEPFVQEMGYRPTDLGVALYIRIRTRDDQQLSWPEIWSCFVDRYPDQWAIQMFPPEEELIDNANVYHLFVLVDKPNGFGICGL